MPAKLENQDLNFVICIGRNEFSAKEKKLNQNKDNNESGQLAMPKVRWIRNKRKDAAAAVIDLTSPETFSFSATNKENAMKRNENKCRTTKLLFFHVLLLITSNQFQWPTISIDNETSRKNRFFIHISLSVLSHSLVDRMTWQTNTLRRPNADGRRRRKMINCFTF